jgi:hypothetical protein
MKKGRRPGEDDLAGRYAERGDAMPSGQAGACCDRADEEEPRPNLRTSELLNLRMNLRISELSVWPGFHPGQIYSCRLRPAFSHLTFGQGEPCLNCWYKKIRKFWAYGFLKILIETMMMLNLRCFLEGLRESSWQRMERGFQGRRWQLRLLCRDNRSPGRGLHLRQ